MRRKQPVAALFAAPVFACAQVAPIGHTASYSLSCHPKPATTYTYQEYQSTAQQPNRVTYKHTFTFGTYSSGSTEVSISSWAKNGDSWTPLPDKTGKLSFTWRLDATGMIDLKHIAIYPGMFQTLSLIPAKLPLNKPTGSSSPDGANFEFTLQRIQTEPAVGKQNAKVATLTIKSKASGETILVKLLAATGMPLFIQDQSSNSTDQIRLVRIE